MTGPDGNFNPPHSDRVSAMSTAFSAEFSVLPPLHPTGVLAHFTASAGHDREISLLRSAARVPTQPIPKAAVVPKTTAIVIQDGQAPFTPCSDSPLD